MPSSFKNPPFRIPMNRRSFMAGSIGAGLAATTGLSTPALAQAKPDKIVVTALFISWRKTLEEYVAPLFEKQTGIKVEFAFLPVDPLAARLKAQLGSNDASSDVVQLSTAMTNWAAPHLADHKALIQEYGVPDDYDFEGIMEGSRNAYVLDGKQAAIPYRFTTWILHYQPQVLEEAGISKAPRSYQEVQDAAIAVTEKFGPNRFGMGMYGREGDALAGGWRAALFGAGGRYYDESTWEILINRPEAVEALTWYSELAHKHKVVPPESMTWEWDGMTSGAQSDRFAMTTTIGPYATLFEDPALSKTAGRWEWANLPYLHDEEKSVAESGGWALGVVDASPNKRWAFEFVKLATSVAAMKQSAMDGNCPPRAAVLNDPEVTAKLRWAPVYSQQRHRPNPSPTDVMYATLDQTMRPHISRALLGQVGPQEALDATANEWKRSLRRAGLG
jgi:multiple sugar transport system substrate-binding protein